MSKAKKLTDSKINNWKSDRLKDQTGKTLLITGGNSGIGYEAAETLIKLGAKIILACRSKSKADKAIAELNKISSGQVEFLQLDLADLSSVRAAAEQVKQNHDKLDALVNNAGIMQTPALKTKDGFEMQFGTNHLGHFLLTALLIDLVKAANGRVVTLSSIAHKFGGVNFDDLMGEKKYDTTAAYAQSKSANLMFAVELDKRLKAANINVMSIACHPGYSATALQSTGPTGALNFIYKFTNALLAQPAEKGAMPTLLSAAGDEALPGSYYGPTGIGDMRGPISDSDVMPHITKEDDLKKLWEVSEELVGQKFAV